MKTDMNGNVDNTPSILTQIRAAFKASGGKTPDTKTGQKLLGAFREAAKDRDRAETELEAAKMREYAACEALARAYGGESLRFDGQVHDFAARGTKVFFRRGGTNVIAIE